MTQIPKGAVELQPCPFCGSRELRFADSDIEGWISHVECMDCDDMLGPMSEFKYEDVEEARADASNVWNRRTPLSTLPIAGEAPEGWQLVPVKPTDEMLAAIWSVKASNGRNIAEVCYEAMLTASPVPPSSPGKDGGQEVEAVARWLVEEELPGGSKRWEVFEHELHARNVAARYNHRNKTTVTPLYTRPQSASTALVERLTKALTKLEREASEVSEMTEEEISEWYYERHDELFAEQKIRSARAEEKGSSQ